MQHQATLLYSEPLLRRAVVAFWRRTVGRGFLVAQVAVAVCLAALLRQGDRSWVVGAFATILVLSVAFLAALYVVHYRNAMGKFREMGAPQASMLAEESGFTFASGIGSSSLRWASVREVWRFDEVWLLLFSKAQFVTLPVGCLPPEMRAFILERVKAAGGKVEG